MRNLGYSSSSNKLLLVVNYYTSVTTQNYNKYVITISYDIN